jgi:serine/threonine-protein kinase RsbW
MGSPVLDVDAGGTVVPDLTPADQAIRIVLPSEPTAVRRALKQLEMRLSPLGLNVEEDGTMQIVLAEALNNIVEHAYSGTIGVVELEAARGDAGLAFTITDRGLPMPDGEVPLGRIPDYPSDPSEMPEGGFGWFLIHDLTHELSYQRIDDRNVLRFRLALGAVRN